MGIPWQSRGGDLGSNPWPGNKDPKAAGTVKILKNKCFCTNKFENLNEMDTFLEEEKENQPAETKEKLPQAAANKKVKKD